MTHTGSCIQAGALAAVFLRCYFSLLIQPTNFSQFVLDFLFAGNFIGLTFLLASPLLILSYPNNLPAFVVPVVSSDSEDAAGACVRASGDR